MLIAAMAIAMTARVGREQILMLSFIRYLQVGGWETTASIHQNAALEVFLNVFTTPNCKTSSRGYLTKSATLCVLMV
jgi:hypothetical protein